MSTRLPSLGPFSDYVDKEKYIPHSEFAAMIGMQPHALSNRLRGYKKYEDYIERRILREIVVAGLQAYTGVSTQRRPIPRNIRAAVISRDGNLCRYCGRKVGNRTRHIDHIRPVSDGGTDDLTNLVVACERCNHAKSTDLPHVKNMSLRPIPGEYPGAEAMYKEQLEIASGRR